MSGAPPPDPRIVDEIGKVCMASGYFRQAGGVIASFVPQATLPVALAEAGVQIVCANPTKFATDVSTVKWLIEQFAKAHQTAAARQ